MIIKAPRNSGLLLGGKTQGLRFNQTNLYPSAWPFNKANNGSPSSVAFLKLIGKNAAVTTISDLWTLSGTLLRTNPTVGFTLAVSSSSTNDTAAGTGARIVEVDGIEAITFAAKTVTLTLAGQTKVTDASGVSFIRINDVRVISVGSGLTNAGIIYAYDNAVATVTAGVPQTASVIYGTVAIGDNQTRQAMYMVPAGYQAQISAYGIGIEDGTATARPTTGQLNYGVPVTGGNITEVDFLPGSAGVSLNMRDFAEFPLVIDEKQDITIRATSAVGAAVVVGWADMVLFPKV
jgi:hypothetical protein